MYTYIICISLSTYIYLYILITYLYVYIHLYFTNIYTCIYIYILRISLALFIYMIYFSTITHCSVGIFHQQTGRTPTVPDPAAAQLSVALDHTGAAQKRPVAAGVAISPVRKCRNNRLTEIQPINMVM